MKKIIFILLAIICSNNSFGQNFKAPATSEFVSVESYKPAESQVLLCANYLFEHPADEEELNRLNSVRYIINWMTGTPDYTFEIGKQAVELTKGNSDLLGLYIAAMSKVVIENEDEELSNDEVYERAKKLLVDYCAAPENKMKPSKKIKKIIKESKK